jgi:predicted helicase
LDWEAEIGVSYLETKVDEFTPTDLLDYIYAVLHSPSYREKYKEFLKIDFPRIPFNSKYTGDISDPRKENERFWRLVELGRQLRKLHLMESINGLEASSWFGYPESGDNVVKKIRFERETEPLKTGDDFDRIPHGLDFWDYPGGVFVGKVWLNDMQYFANVPEMAWKFFIGGYQPAQKWLKDRKGRELTFNDILHYQKIIHVLAETERVMGVVDKVFVV